MWAQSELSRSEWVLFWTNHGFLGSKDLMLKSHRKQNVNDFSLFYQKCSLACWLCCVVVVTQLVCVFETLFCLIIGTFSTVLLHHTHTLLFASVSTLFTGKGSLTFICYLLQNGPERNNPNHVNANVNLFGWISLGVSLGVIDGNNMMTQKDCVLCFCEHCFSLTAESEGQVIRESMLVATSVQIVI